MLVDFQWDLSQGAHALARFYLGNFKTQISVLNFCSTWSTRTISRQGLVHLIHTQNSARANIQKRQAHLRVFHYADWCIYKRKLCIIYEFHYVQTVFQLTGYGYECEWEWEAMESLGRESVRRERVIFICVLPISQYWIKISDSSVSRYR